MEDLNDLDSVYAKLIGRLPSDLGIARVLTFIQCARRPLNFQELAFAMAIRSKHSSAQTVIEDQFLALDKILEVYASSLVLFQNNTISLVHPSLGAHLEKRPGQSIAETHREMAKACLWTLLLSTKTLNTQFFLTGAHDKASEGTFFDLSSNPFMLYASEYWFEHVRLALGTNFDEEIFNLTQDFVKSKLWWTWSRWYTEVSGKGVYPSDGSPIHIFASLDLLNHKNIFQRLSSGLSQEASSLLYYYAVANNSRATIDFFLDTFPLIPITDDILPLAVTKTNLRLLKHILQHADVEISHSLILSAMDGRHSSAFNLLLEHLEKSKTREQVRHYWETLSNDQGGALHHAVLSHNLKLTQSFLNDGADPNNGAGGQIPLHLAARIGDESIAKELINFGSDVNSLDDHGHTPLHYATKIGALRLVKLLVTYGADIGVCDTTGLTVLHVAVERGYEDVVLVLLASGAQVNVKGKDGTTPLHLAYAGGWGSIAKRLLDQGAESSTTADTDRTPLHLACANGSLEISMMLLGAGVSIDARDISGQTPLHAAVQRGSIDLVKLLLNAGANPSASDKNGRTPLHYAAISDFASAAIVQLLIELGADVEVRDDLQKKTALELAQAGGNNVIIALLQSTRQVPARVHTKRDPNPKLRDFIMGNNPFSRAGSRNASRASTLYRRATLLCAI